jgi:hypothetical protein
LLAEETEELRGALEVSARGRSGEGDQAERQADDDRVDAGPRQSQPGGHAQQHADAAVPDPDPDEEHDESEEPHRHEEGERM